MTDYSVNDVTLTILGASGVPSNNLVSRWRFIPGSITADNYGSAVWSLPGLTADPTTNYSQYVDGYSSVEFVAANSQYMEIADSDLPVGFPMRHADGAGAVTQFSVTGWIRHAIFYGGLSIIYILSKYSTLNDGRSWALGRGGPNSDVHNIRFIMGNDGSSYTSYSHEYSLYANEWYFICGAVDLVNSTLRLMVRDVRGNILGTDISHAITGTTITTAAPLKIGSRNDAGFYNGLMNDMRIYSSVLNSHDATAIARQGLRSGIMMMV